MTNREQHPSCVVCSLCVCSGVVGDGTGACHGKIVLQRSRKEVLVFVIQGRDVNETLILLGFHYFRVENHVSLNKILFDGHL